MDEADSILQGMFDMVERLKVPAADLGQYLLPERHQRVLDELQRRQAATRGSSSKDKNYIPRHQEYIEATGISWTSLAPAAGIAKSPWYQLLPQREKEIVAFYSTTIPHAVAIDTSQRIDRASVPTGPLILNTLTPGSKNFLVGQMSIGKDTPAKPNRILLGYESLGLQAFPVEELEPLDWLSDPQMQDLAGNAFPGTCLLAVFLAMYAKIPKLATRTRVAFDVDEMRSLLADA